MIVVVEEGVLVGKTSEFLRGMTGGESPDQDENEVRSLAASLTLEERRRLEGVFIVGGLSLLLPLLAKLAKLSLRMEDDDDDDAEES